MKISDIEFTNIEKQLNIKFEFYCNLEIIEHNNSTFSYPQRNYNNTKNYHFIADIDMNTPFCKFKPNLPKTNGVYLWVVDDEIIYIGETVNLKSRFNSGYGNISPRNCYKGGQSTNVKMNRVVLNYHKLGKTIAIYICQNLNHKEIELKLLQTIKTKYNNKLTILSYT